MGQEYFRPSSLDELNRRIKNFHGTVIPLYGVLDYEKINQEDVLLVDLQDAGLNSISSDGQYVHLGSGVLLDQFAEYFSSNLTLSDIIFKEFTQNQRNQICIGAVIQISTGRSALLTALLAYDATVKLASSPGLSIPLGDFLYRRTGYSNQIISTISIPDGNSTLKFEAIRRSPVDFPIVCAAMVKWKSGRVRLCLGGYGASPVMAFDGRETGGIGLAAKSAFYDAADGWASAEYRRTMSEVLAVRLANST